MSERSGPDRRVPSWAKPLAPLADWLKSVDRILEENQPAAWRVVPLAPRPVPIVSGPEPPPTDMFASDFEPVVEIPGLYHPKSSIGLLDISNDVLLESVADRMQPAAAIAQGLFGFPWGLPAREIFAWELMTDGRWDQTCHGVTLPDGQRLYLSVHLVEGACCPCGLMVLAVYRGSDPEEADTRLLQLFQSTRGAVIGIKRCIGVRPGGGYWGEGDQVEFV